MKQKDWSDFENPDQFWGSGSLCQSPSSSVGLLCIVREVDAGGGSVCPCSQPNRASGRAWPGSPSWNREPPHKKRPWAQRISGRQSVYLRKRNQALQSSPPRAHSSKRNFLKTPEAPNQLHQGRALPLGELDSKIWGQRRKLSSSTVYRPRGKRKRESESVREREPGREERQNQEDNWSKASLLGAHSADTLAAGGICGEDLRGEDFILILPQKHSSEPSPCEKVREQKTGQEESGWKDPCSRPLTAHLESEPSGCLKTRKRRKVKFKAMDSACELQAACLSHGQLFLFLEKGITFSWSAMAVSSSFFYSLVAKQLSSREKGGRDPGDKGKIDLYSVTIWNFPIKIQSHNPVCPGLTQQLPILPLDGRWDKDTCCCPGTRSSLLSIRCVWFGHIHRGPGPALSLE